VPPSRPRWFDFFLLLTGVGLSLVLTDLSGLRARPTEATPEAVLPALAVLPQLLLLPLGVLLFWPLFFLTQKIAGRPQPLSAGEWLWGVAWLAAVLFTVWLVWQALGTPPEFLSRETFRKYAPLGYAIGILALAAVALVIGLVDMIGRWGQPWTHHCCLALVMWPVLPLLAFLLWEIKPE
jgi:hypothetical protein